MVQLRGLPMQVMQMGLQGLHVESVRYEPGAHAVHFYVLVVRQPMQFMPQMRQILELESSE